MSNETLVHRENGLVTVTLNRPETKNAINGQVWADLDAVFTEVAHNPEDRALLLTGAGSDFSSGADLSGGLNSKNGQRPAGGRERQSMVWEMRIAGAIVNRLHEIPKPTIAAVDGVAIGVAMGLALACDLIIATDRARFCQIFVKRGLSMDGGTSWSLPRQVGIRRAKQLAFFGDMLDAESALRMGLVNTVVSPDELPQVASDWGHRLASGPTTTLSLMKRLIDESEGLTFSQSIEAEARAQHIAFTTKDMAEGMRAYMERRPPQFIGS